MRHARATYTTPSLASDRPTSLVSLVAHPARGAESGPRVACLAAKHLLDAKELVVLGSTLTTARRTRLDLSRLEAHGEVGDVVVLSLARTVGGHDAPAVLLGELNGIDRLGDGANLVHLEEEAVGGLRLDRLLDLGRVGHGQIITNDLHINTKLGSDLRPVSPVILIERILNRHNRVLGAHLSIHLQELVTGEEEVAIPRLKRRLKIKIVFILAVHLELGRGNIKTNSELVKVTSVVDSLHAHGEARVDVAGRCEATLIADEGRVTTKLPLDDSLEVMEDLTSHAHRLTERLRTSRNHEELLERELVARVLATVNDIEARDWHRELAAVVASKVRVVLEQWDLLSTSAGLGHGERRAEDGVGAEVALVRGAIEIDHEVVNALLVTRILADKSRGDGVVHVPNSAKDTLTHVTGATVAKLSSLIDASRGTRRARGSEHTIGSGHINLNGRVTTRVNDLTPVDGGDGGHGAAASRRGGGAGGGESGFGGDRHPRGSVVTEEWRGGWPRRVG
mmetsp:Transcript_35776/g.82841  ORF Transcript_35776/g.82841 Transcript_35776/m.82841 type:complete len:509 (-) Transcript_35776:20-1546(-)